MLCVQGSQHALKWRNEPIYYHAMVSCEREITQFVQEWNPYVQIELIFFFSLKQIFSTIQKLFTNTNSCECFWQFNWNSVPGSLARFLQRLNNIFGFITPPSSKWLVQQPATRQNVKWIFSQWRIIMHFNLIIPIHVRIRTNGRSTPTNKSLDFLFEIEAMQNDCGDQYFSESVVLLVTATKLNTI